MLPSRSYDIMLNINLTASFVFSSSSLSIEAESVGESLEAHIIGKLAFFLYNRAVEERTCIFAGVSVSESRFLNWTPEMSKLCTEEALPTLTSIGWMMPRWI